MRATLILRLSSGTPASRNRLSEPSGASQACLSAGARSPVGSRLMHMWLNVPPLAQNWHQPAQAQHVLSGPQTLRGTASSGSVYPEHVDTCAAKKCLSVALRASEEVQWIGGLRGVDLGEVDLGGSGSWCTPMPKCKWISKCAHKMTHKMCTQIHTQNVSTVSAVFHRNVHSSVSQQMHLQQNTPQQTSASQQSTHHTVRANVCQNAHATSAA